MRLNKKSSLNVVRGKKEVYKQRTLAKKHEVLIFEKKIKPNFWKEESIKFDHFCSFESSLNMENDDNGLEKIEKKIQEILSEEEKKIFQPLKTFFDCLCKISRSQVEKYCESDPNRIIYSQTSIFDQDKLDMVMKIEEYCQKKDFKKQNFFELFFKKCEIEEAECAKSEFDEKLDMKEETRIKIIKELSDEDKLTVHYTYKMLNKNWDSLHLIYHPITKTVLKAINIDVSRSNLELNSTSILRNKAKMNAICRIKSFEPYYDFINPSIELKNTIIQKSRDFLFVTPKKKKRGGKANISLLSTGIAQPRYSRVDRRQKNNYSPIKFIVPLFSKKDFYKGGVFSRKKHDVLTQLRIEGNKSRFARFNPDHYYHLGKRILKPFRFCQKESSVRKKVKI